MKNASILVFFSLMSLLSAANYTLSVQLNGITWSHNNSLVASESRDNFTVLIFNSSTCANVSVVYNQSFIGNLTNGSISVMLGENVPLVLLIGNTYYEDFIINATDGAGGKLVNDLTYRNNDGTISNCKAFVAPVGIGWLNNNSETTYAESSRPANWNLTGNLSIGGYDLVVGNMRPCYENGTNCMFSNFNQSINNASAINTSLDTLRDDLNTTDKSFSANFSSMNNATIVHKNSTSGIENATINASNITNPEWGLALNCGIGNAIQASVITGAGTCIAVGGTGNISGNGTSGYLPLWNNSGQQNNSNIRQNSSRDLNVIGNINATNFYVGSLVCLTSETEPSWNGNSTNITIWNRNQDTNISDLITDGKSQNNTIETNFTNISTRLRNLDTNVSSYNTTIGLVITNLSEKIGKHANGLANYVCLWNDTGFINRSSVLLENLLYGGINLSGKLNVTYINATWINTTNLSVNGTDVFEQMIGINLTLNISGNNAWGNLTQAGQNGTAINNTFNTLKADTAVISELTNQTLNKTWVLNATANETAQNMSAMNMTANNLKSDVNIIGLQANQSAQNFTLWDNASIVRKDTTNNAIGNATIDWQNISNKAQTNNSENLSTQYNLTVQGGILLNMSIAKITCGAGNRGFLQPEFGGAGVDDLLYWCAKNATDVYNWVLVARGS